MRREQGQATVELIGALPAILLLGAVVMQILAVGYAAVLAGTAAEAGALALAAGGDARVAARGAVPDPSRAGMRLDVEPGRVRVTLRPPSLLPAVARRLEVGATAAVEVP